MYLEDIDISWKVKYDHHILNGNLAKATELKNGNINRSLFKYRCFDKNKDWVKWINGTIFVGSPSRFNDPFDCLLSVTADAKRKLLIDAAKEFLSEKVKLSKLDKSRLAVSDNTVEAICTILEQNGVLINRELIDGSLLEAKMREKTDSKFRDIFKISCFSENNNSILMWSHYANHHQGFCIEYDFSNDKHVSNKLYPVTYSTQRFILQLCHLKKKSSWSISAVLCKASEWAYENEWRYINAVNPDAADQSDSPIILSTPNSIKSVYLGVDAMNNNKESVENLKHATKELKIPLYEMKFDDFEYKLVPKKIS